METKKITLNELRTLVKQIIKEDYRPDKKPPYSAKSADEVVAIVFDFVKRNQSIKKEIALRIADGLKY